MSSVEKTRDRESRHLWVGGLPDDVDEVGIKDFFTRYGEVLMRHSFKTVTGSIHVTL